MPNDLERISNPSFKDQEPSLSIINSAESGMHISSVSSISGASGKRIGAAVAAANAEDSTKDTKLSGIENDNSRDKKIAINFDEFDKVVEELDKERLEGTAEENK